MRLARSVTTCSVAAPAGTITHATRGGRSARTKSSSSVVPLAPSLAIALTFAGSVAYPTTSWPPRIRRRAMFAPILPSPPIPTCMESSSRLDGPAQLAQAGFHIAPEVHAQRPPPARPEDLEVAERLRRLHHAEGVSPPWYREVLPVVTRDLDEDARIRSALVRDRKSTRLNSSHVRISYAVLCLQKNWRTVRPPPPSIPLRPSDFYL